MLGRQVYLLTRTARDTKDGYPLPKSRLHSGGTWKRKVVGPNLTRPTSSARLTSDHQGQLPGEREPGLTNFWVDASGNAVVPFNGKPLFPWGLHKPTIPTTAPAPACHTVTLLPDRLMTNHNEGRIGVLGVIAFGVVVSPRAKLERRKGQRKSTAEMTFIQPSSICYASSEDIAGYATPKMESEPASFLGECIA